MVDKKKGKKDESRFIRVKRTFGQISSDSLTKWAGSWIFIFAFLVLIVLWIATNIYGWINQWDPYPFILLNLGLSLLAAIQAPVILMSQNRQSQKEHIREKYNYAVNRKAEREIQEIKTLILEMHAQRKPR